MLVLTLNAGSSSLKFSLFESAEEQKVLNGQVHWSGSSARYVCRSGDEIVQDFEIPWAGFSNAFEFLVSKISSLLDGKPIELVSHRIVHGGNEFTQPCRITRQVVESLEHLIPLAPLHLPGTLEVIQVSREILAQIPHIAVFDTAFHQTIPDTAAIYPIPKAWTDRWKLRRFGFHGLSHEYCTTRTQELLGDSPQASRLVIAHIGSGVSITAVDKGRSVDTTMGFTPLEGVMMATRCGNIDPGLILHLQRDCGISLDELAEALNIRSGLIGVSGVSGDIRDVLKEMDNGHQDSKLAFEIYIHRLCQGIASMAASLKGIDALIFTGGVGTNSSVVRSAVCDRLKFLGLEIDLESNQHHEGDALISNQESKNKILVIETDEEIMLCRHAAQQLKFAVQVPDFHD